MCVCVIMCVCVTGLFCECIGLCCRMYRARLQMYRALLQKYRALYDVCLCNDVCLNNKSHNQKLLPMCEALFVNL